MTQPDVPDDAIAAYKRAIELKHRLRTTTTSEELKAAPAK